ncbi:MAG: hypothetical protein WD316_08415 [Phycisphaeraceae bacterium]
MLILNTPVCPACSECVMTREFSGVDRWAMVVSLVLFFPLAIWLFLTPRRLYCQNCGKMLAPQPPNSA